MKNQKAHSNLILQDGLLKFILNQKGVSLPQVIIMLGITSILSLSVASIANMQNKGQYEMSLKSSALAMRQNFMGTIANQGSWEKTRTLNSGMRCTGINQAHCNALAGHSTKLINLYNSAGQLILDSTNSSAGFTSFGEPCIGFTTAGNDSCPIRVMLTWRAACTAASCTAAEFSADELISLEFVYSPTKNKNVPFNPQNFNLVEQSRLRITDNSSPVLSCAESGKVFIGIQKTYRGNVADSKGCVSYAAFVGDTGARGSDGPRGSTGSTGPAGRDAVCP